MPALSENEGFTHRSEVAAGRVTAPPTIIGWPSAAQFSKGDKNSPAQGHHSRIQLDGSNDLLEEFFGNGARLIRPRGIHESADQVSTPFQ